MAPPLAGELHLGPLRPTSVASWTAGARTPRRRPVRSAGIEAVNLHHTEWTGGLHRAFYHRFEKAWRFAWDVQFERQMDELFDSGIDGVYSDHVDRMLDAWNKLD